MRAGELSPEDRANILNLRHGPVLPPLSADAQVFDERAEATLSRMLGPILGSVEVGDERPNSVAALAHPSRLKPIRRLHELRRV